MHCAHERASQDDENTKIIRDALDAHANWATEAVRVKQERLDKECSQLHKEVESTKALLRESREMTQNGRQREDELKRANASLLARARELEVHLASAKTTAMTTCDALEREADRRQGVIEELGAQLETAEKARNEFERLADHRQKSNNGLRCEREALMCERDHMKRELNAVKMMTRNAAIIPGESVSDALCRYITHLHEQTMNRPPGVQALIIEGLRRCNPDLYRMLELVAEMPHGK